MKTEILEAMVTLINEGETLTTENYTGSNPEAFKEFAEVNGFDLEEVVEVYIENEDYLTELFDNH